MRNIHQARLHIVLVFSFLILFIGFTVLVLTKPISQDEGVFLTIGKYLNEGFLPYQDFFDHKPPAIYFLFSGLFKLFGTNVFVVKVALILSVFGSSTLLGKIAEKLKKGTGWYAVIFFLFLITQFEGYFLIAEPFMLFPLLLAFFLLLRSERGKGWLVVTGFSLAIALLFKQTVLVSALPILFLAFKTISKQRTVYFIAGLLLPLVVLGIYLFLHGLLAEAFNQIITLTLTSYPNEPFFDVLRSLRWNFFWTLPLWILLLLGLGTKFPRNGIIWTLALLLVPFLFFRHYPHYWVQILPFVAIIAACSLTNLRPNRVLTLSIFVFCLSVAGGKVAHDVPKNYRLLQEQLSVADELKKLSSDALLAENQFAGFYFLLPIPPINKYLYITEINNTTLAAQQTTITDLQQNQSTLILWPMDPNYAYAKELQTFLASTPTILTNELLGLRVMRFSPTSQ